MGDLSADPAALTQVLSMLNQNDTDVVKKGEQFLKPFLKQASCIPSLVHQLRTSADEQVRHQAAILLKRRANPLLKKFNQTQVRDLKAQFLHLMTAEPSKPIAVALAGAVASISKSIFTTEGNWPELFALLTQLAQDPLEARRALNYSLLEQLAEAVAPNLKPHTAVLAQMFVMGCQDSSSHVSAAAMAATGAYIKALADEPEVMQLQCVLMPMLQVMQACLERGDEDLVIEAMDVLGDIVNMDQPLINDHVEQITPFMVTILGCDKYESSVRSSAGQMLISLIENRPKLVAKKNLVTPVLTALVELIAKSSADSAGTLFCFAKSEEKGDDDDDDEDYEEDDEEEGNIDRLVQTLVDSMAISIPSKHFVQPALALCSQGMSSPDGQMRKAGCAILGVIAEGCSDTLKQCLAEIMPPLLSLLKDQEFFVREVACFALGQLSEHCQPDILHYHSTVLPAVYLALEDEKHTVQSTACYVLEMFLENLQRETLRPFLQPLLMRLMTLLSSPHKVAQELALTAISSAAVCAEIEFLPYAEGVCSVLGPILFNTEPKQFTLRGRSLETLGHVAVAIGAEPFARYFESGMQSAMQALQLDNDDLKEHSYVFFANTSKVMGKAFQPYLAQLVPLLLEVVTESDLVNAPDDDDEEEEEDEDEEGGPGQMYINVMDGFVNNKKAALTALSSMAENTCECFAPYLKDTMDAMIVEEMSGAAHSYHDIVRGEAHELMSQLVAVACHTENVPQKPAKLVMIPLPPNTADVVKTAMKYYIDAMGDDESKQSVSMACEAAGSVITRCGCTALSLRLDPPREHPEQGSKMVVEALQEKLLLIMNEKTPCQKVSRDDKEEDDEDGDHDNVMLDSAADLICTLAKTLGEQIVPFFDTLQNPLMKFMKPARPFSDRSMAIGIYGEVLLEVGGHALKYVEPLMPIIKVSLADSMEAVRRNAAYCLGVLVRIAGPALVPHYMAMLQSLHPLCTRPAEQMGADKGGADVDNALSTVAYMIKTDLNAMKMVLPQVLPAMLAALPLRSDQSEGPNVYGCIVELLLGGDPTTQSQLPEVLRVFGDVLSTDSSAETEAKERVVLCIRTLASNAQSQGALAAALGQVTSPTARAAVETTIMANA